VRRLLALAFLFLPLGLSAADDPTYKALRAARPDGRTIAVEGFGYDSDVYHFTLTGTLHLLAPADGQNVAAVFLGSGRYELKPAIPAEQRQLALWANDEKLTVLSDDFDRAVFFSSDLLKAAEGKGGAPRSGSPDSQAGGVFETYMKKQRKDFSTNVHLRVVQDLLNMPAESAFMAYVDGKKYPPAMLVVDPLGALSGGGGEETMMYVSHDTKGGVWYSSHLRKEVEKGVARIPPPLADAEHYVIDANIKPNAEIEGTTTMTIVPSVALRVLPINLAPKARMSDVSFAPAGPEPVWTGAAFIQEDEKEDADAAIVFPAPVKAGEKLLVKVTYKGKDVNQILSLTVDEAMKFFVDKRAVVKRLSALRDVGLGYLRLGQSTDSLSGGEAQRLKLASFLAENAKGEAGRLFLFDEPTTGLHWTDVGQLIKTFRDLIERGNSVLVIEHNTQLIEAADWVIDLGPEGGDQGGEVVAVGTPEEIAADPRSITGKYLFARRAADAVA